MWAISRCETNWRAQCRVYGHGIASAVYAADAWVARAGAADATFEARSHIVATGHTRVNKIWVDRGLSNTAVDGAVWALATFCEMRNITLIPM